MTQIGTAASLLIGLALLGGGFDQSNATSIADKIQKLKARLREIDNGSPSPKDRSALYAVSFVDLNDDKIEEAVVFLSGKKWCGSCGCTLLVFTDVDKNYRLITKCPCVHAPVRLLENAGHGWRSLGVRRRIGSDASLREVELTFNGSTYPETLSSEFVRDMLPSKRGLTLIASNTATPLYQ